MIIIGNKSSELNNSCSFFLFKLTHIVSKTIAEDSQFDGGRRNPADSPGQHRSKISIEADFTGTSRGGETLLQLHSLSPSEDDLS